MIHSFTHNEGMLYSILAEGSTAHIEIVNEIKISEDDLIQLYFGFCFTLPKVKNCDIIFRVDKSVAGKLVTNPMLNITYYHDGSMEYCHIDL